MQERIKSIFKNRNFRYILVYVCILILYHALMRHYDGDIEFYLRSSWEDPEWGPRALFNLVYDRYITQTSRVLLEAPLFAITHGMHVTVFNILNILINVGLYMGLMRLTDNRHNDILLCLILLYPIAEMNTAGWIVCYTIYIWPLTMAVVALNSLKDMYETKKIPAAMMIIYLLCLIYASNLEQIAFMYLGILVMFTIFMATGHRFDRGGIIFTVLQFLMVIGNIIFSLTGPGNHGKTIWMGAHWFPDYASLTLVDKAMLAVNTTMAYLIEKSLIWPALCALLLACVIARNPGNIFRITVSAIPLAASILRSVMYRMSESYFNDFRTLMDVYSDIARLDPSNYNSFSAVFTFIFNMLIATIVLISIIWIAVDIKWAVFTLVMMLFGYGIRAMIAFSPTVYAAGQRTFMVTEFIIIYLIIWIYSENREILRGTLPKYTIPVGHVILCLMAVFSVINNTLAITNAYYYGWK